MTRPEQPAARHPRAEAQAILGPDLEARVLEPSPPAVLEGPWFADDPVDPAGARRPVVSPAASRGACTWDDWLREQPGHAAWAADRWLGAHRRLGPPPAGLAATRLALNRLAVYVVSPARRRANGKIALRWTLGGVGTPFFGDDEQVRIEGTLLVRQRGGSAAAEPVTTLARAAAFVLDGAPDDGSAAGHDLPPAGDPEAPLLVDPDAAAFLGDWFGFAHSVLEELRADPAAANAGRVQIWPEHFDAAFDCTPGGGDGRATFGASPGDAAVGEPYLYVLPPENPPGPPERWNATSFPGAILQLGGFLDAADQRAAALAFLRDRIGLMAG
jgi:hypothetical protein